MYPIPNINYFTFTMTILPKSIMTTLIQAHTKDDNFTHRHRPMYTSANGSFSTDSRFTKAVEQLLLLNEVGTSLCLLRPQLQFFLVIIECILRCTSNTLT